MKKGDYVIVSENAMYNGQDMKWTEKRTKTKVLKTGTKLIHCSDAKLTSFVEKETCFFTSDRGNGHVYVVTLTKDIIASMYGSEEARIEINTNNVTIQYAGWRGKSKKTKYAYKDYTDKKYLQGVI